MYSAAVKTSLAPAGDAPEPAPHPLRWADWPASRMAHHGRACCDVARAWILGMDSSQMADGSGLSGPRWLKHRYPWGPSPWPMHWCEAVERRKLDCGAHAAISQELFTARGVRSFPAQFTQQFTREAASHWAESWGDEGIPPRWIDRDVIYHEGCAVVVGVGEVKLWDASAGWWINTDQHGGYGSLVSVRILADGGEYRWGARRLRSDVWEQIAT